MEDLLCHPLRGPGEMRVGEIELLAVWILTIVGFMLF